jgi:hypothetical protein
MAAPAGLGQYRAIRPEWAMGCQRFGFSGMRFHHEELHFDGVKLGGFPEI